MWSDSNYDNSEMQKRIKRVHKEMKEEENEKTK